MNFSRISRQLNEDATAMEASAKATERATQGGQQQMDQSTRRRDKQKAQMATQKSVPQKSDVSYTSERYEREQITMLEDNLSDWRKDLNEAMGPGEEGEHPFVDVMPFVNQKQREAKRQEKGMERLEGGKQAKMAESKELSIDDQMRISREAAKNRNPKPDHKAIRGKMLKKPLPKDTRTDAEKMTDATGPRPGSRYRGD